MSLSKRILVVDDEEQNRDLLQAVLESCGYASEAVEDGFQALKRLASDVDLVLLDVMMPDLDGYEVARRIRGHPAFGDTPIIMVTVLQSKEDRLRAVEAGANDFVSKPIDRLELKVRIASLLKMKEAQDAIKRHRAELETMVDRRTRALRESEEKYRLLFNNANEAIAVIQDGRFKFINPKTTELFGLSEDELLMRPVADLIHKDDRKRFEKRNQARLKGEEFTDLIAFRVAGGTGDKPWIEMHSVAIEWDGRPATLNFGSDITQRRQAEQALRESEARFRAIFEGARDCIFLKDSRLRYTHVNPSMERLFEMRSADLVGRTDAEIFGYEAAKPMQDVDARVLGGDYVEWEHSRLVNGVPITFHEIRMPMRDRGGRVNGLCGIARNITERKKVAAQPHVSPPQDYPSETTRLAMARALLAGENDSIVLLTGESGSGKDFFARYIHDHSKRADGPFFSINCAAVPHDLAESELFGHEAGAFTGATKRKRGLLELAEGGTLLLNEIGELSLIMQAKLLTFLDTHSFTRVGGEKSVSVNARLVAATNRDLKQAVEEGRFRNDLFYRLNVLHIVIPALRDRIDDLPILVKQIMAELARRMQPDELPEIDPAALEALMRYSWPGNVRELRNVLERAIMLGRGDVVHPGMLGLEGPNAQWSYRVTFPEGSTLQDITDEIKRSLVVEALRRSGGSKTGSAKMLGISRDSLYRYIDRFGIPV